MSVFSRSGTGLIVGGMMERSGAVNSYGINLGRGVGEAYLRRLYRADWIPLSRGKSKKIVCRECGCMYMPSEKMDRCARCARKKPVLPRPPSKERVASEAARVRRATVVYVCALPGCGRSFTQEQRGVKGKALYCSVACSALAKLAKKRERAQKRAARRNGDGRGAPAAEQSGG